MSGCAQALTDEEMFAKLGDEKILARASAIIAASETPAPTATPSPSAEPTPEPTPVRKLTPADLMGEGLNPFYNVDFPQGYTAYAAKADTGNPDNEKPTYSLYLTAEGDPAETVQFMCQLMGIDDATSIASYVDGMNRDGLCGIDGSSVGNGTIALCAMKKTQKGADFDRCDDVDGCRIELISFIDAARLPEYRAVFLDNYNLKGFGDMAESLSGSLVPNRFMVTVNTQRPKFTMVSAVHEVDDAAALIKSMSETLKYGWYDDQGPAIGIPYGKLDSGVGADLEKNLIFVDQTLYDADTAAAEYTKADVSLSSLGFGYSEKDALCTYEKDGYTIAVHKPEWGQREEEWNISFFTQASGYNFVIWYIDNEQRYTVQVDKGDSIAKYDYFAAENRFDEGYPDKETVQQLFKKVFGNPEEYQYNAAIDRFNKYFSDTFGMTADQLYALPLE
jgi:hypothetical protein